ncbi:DinB family protein [Paenibacillus thailandensis]|uniref:DinB family protein n=1 Tax=Paenibacillus thailandensis TaxID=393250 RepID=A0ABW5R4G2_9BACL
MIAKPQQGEYNPFYDTYIGKIPEGDLIAVLERQQEETVKLLGELPEDKHLYRYAPDKWTLKEVLGHIIDNERIMSFRMMCIAYGEQKPLPGYDQDEYMASDPYAGCTLPQLLEEYKLVRQATIALLKRLPEKLLANRGTANGGPASARAFAYIIAGHELHHMSIIKERYL